MTGNLVHVMTNWQTGISEPAFLIKKGDVYYVTLALWEYDPNRTFGDPAKQQGVLDIADIFNNDLEDTGVLVREFTGAVAAPMGDGDHTNGNLP